MKKSIALILCLFGTSVAVACGGSDSGSSGSDNCSSPMGSNASADCLACVKGSCGSQYSSYCSGNCGANASTSSCQNAAAEIGSCVIQNCTTECDTGNQDGNAGSGSGGSPVSSGGSKNGSGGSKASNGGSANGSGGAGTATTPNCVKLAACCPTLPGGNDVQGPCAQSAGYNNDGPCLGLLKAYQKAGQCSDTPSDSVAVICSMGKICNKQTVPMSVKETYEMACTSSDGTLVDACPTADLIGCCTLSTSEVCSYDPDANFNEAQCTQTTGKWSTTP